MSRGTLVSILLVGVGLVNFAPVVGLLGADKLAGLYGIAEPAGDLEVLLRHRALLFGLVGGFIIWSAFKPIYQPVAMCLAGVSMLGFIALAWLVGEPGARLYQVALVDGVACALLLLAVVLHRLHPRNPDS
jgi:hypothetical protein